MGIKINTTGLLKLLDSLPENQNIMLTGKHGIGKSQILTKYFEEKNQKVVTLFLGQMSDPGDLIGLPHLDERSKKTDFMLPYWWPNDGKPIVLFLDELNRARPEILQTIMDLALNRKLAGKTLPEGSRIISAVNDGEEYQLIDLDPALVSRFNIYDFKPTVSEWLLWAQKSGINSSIIDFISQNPNYLDGDDFKREDQGLEKSPDRRGWEKVSDFLNKNPTLEEFHKTIIAGIVGMAAAVKFMTFVSNINLPGAKDILLGDFSEVKTKLEKLKSHEYAAISESLFRFIETQGGDSESKKKIGKNFEAYFDFLTENNLRESQAYFSSLYTSTSYPGAIVFVMTKCSSLYKKMESFIKSI